MSNVISVALSTGTTLPYRPATAKSGNAYHAILDPATGKAAGKFGVNVTPGVIGDRLPDQVEVLGQIIKLSRGTTQSGNPKASASNVPVSLDGEARSFSLSVSKTARGYNVRGSINRPGGGGRPPASTL